MSAWRIVSLILLLVSALMPSALASPAANPDALTVADPFYPTYLELGVELINLINSYPNIVTYEVLGQETHGSNRNIIALKISDNPTQEEDEPAWVFTGVIHGAEQLGLRVVMDLADHLTSNYGADQDVTHWVDAYEIWIIPLLNPYGYDHDSSGNSQETGTRKNGANTGVSSTSGVDLARNYDFFHDKGGSTDPDSSYYRGLTPFSENETQAVQALFLDQRPLFGITFHQGTNPDGGQIMWPWRTDGVTWVSDPPDRAQIEAYAELYADWVYQSRLGGPLCDGSLYNMDGAAGCLDSEYYEFCQNLCWEPVTKGLNPIGQPSNWYYSQVGTYDFTVEISDQTFNGDFMHDASGPSTADEQNDKDISTEMAQNNLDAILAWFDHFLYATGPFQFAGPGLTGQITDLISGDPLSATVSVDGYTSSAIADRHSDPDYGRYWRLLPEDTHLVRVSKPGYQTWTDYVVVGSGALTELDVQLTPEIEILLPTDDYPAWVGPADNPGTLTVRLQLGSAGDPCLTGLDFEVEVQDEDSTWVQAPVGTQSCIQDTTWLSAQAPGELDGNFLTDGVYDLRVTLDSVDDEMSNAVRYSERDEDVMFLMDVSGSMAGYDKLEAAQEAAALLVHELNGEDQGGLVAFEADATTPFTLTAMAETSQTLLIDAINSLTTVGNTSLGDGLAAGLDELDGPRADPEHYAAMVLLSDGVENEDQRWSDLITRTQDFTCTVNVVALGPSADEITLQEISEKGTSQAADDGWYLYAAVTDSPSAPGSQSADWPNRLAGAYDEIGREMAGRQRFFYKLGLAERAPDEHLIQVDGTLDDALFALKWSGTGTQGVLELVQPDGVTVTLGTPGVQHRSSSSHDLFHIVDPMPGTWRALAHNQTPQQEDLHYVLLGSGRSSIRFETHTSAELGPVRRGQAVLMGGMLTQNAQPITGTNVFVIVEGADGQRNRLRLYDDGGHEDGAADDGFYANRYDRLIAGDKVTPNPGEGDELQHRGSVNYRAIASGPAFTREDAGAFAVLPSADTDLDGLPDPWELAHGLNPGSAADAAGDPDLDGLPNSDEFQAGTDPHDSDTDDGGENDGSEVTYHRDPLWPHDDAISGVIELEASPLPSAALLTWTVSPGHNSYQLWRRTMTPTLAATSDGWEQIAGALPPTGVHTDTGLLNSTPYQYMLGATGEGGQGSALSPAAEVTPVADPFPPQGVVLINGGAQVTVQRPVTLTFVMTDPDAIEVRLASKLDEGTDEVAGPWRPFQPTMGWSISPDTRPGELWRVYAQFQDRAGNRGKIVTAEILYRPQDHRVYLPLVVRSL